MTRQVLNFKVITLTASWKMDYRKAQLEAWRLIPKGKMILP